MLKLVRPIVKPLLRQRFKDFKTSLQRPGDTQQRLLQTLIGKLAATEYGQALNINAKDGYDEFRAKAPIVTYDEISEWVERQKKFEGQALVDERVLFYEKTSGSAAAAKFIPYTRSLKNSFNRMFLIWLDDLLENAPTLSSGKTFISISPAFHRQKATERGVRVGLEDDAEYLNYWAQLLLKPFFVLPSNIKRLQDPANFKRVVAALLVAEERLEIISVWNPSFLEILLDHIKANRELLITDLRRGRVICEGLEFSFKKPLQERLALLEANPLDWQRLWGALKLISCWTSAHAAPAASRLRALFPDTFVQGKGLLATEAPLTVPLIAAQGFVPLPAEVFYEFLDETGTIALLEELEVGCEYEIVLTQQGGLSRYHIGDRVRVTHFYDAVPCLEFIGRSDAVGDLVGEKLNERFVEHCLTRLAQQGFQLGDFQMLIPVLQRQPRYLLIVDSSSSNLPQATAEFETLLNEAYHYRHARQLGQLGAVDLLVAPQASQITYDYFIRKGIKFGDIKHRFLLTSPADAENLLACYQAE